MERLLIEALPNRTLVRLPPENLIPDDSALFSHEFERTLPPVRLVNGIEGTVNLGTISFSKKVSTRSGLPIPEATARLRNLPRFARNFILPASQRASGAQVIDRWSHNYFHWITDSLTKVMVLQDWDVRDPVILPEYLNRIPFFSESLDWLGVDYVVLSDNRRHRVASLSFMSPTGTPGNPDPQLIQKLSVRLRSPRGGFSENDCLEAPPRDRIWISRAYAKRRRILNEADLLPILQKHNFSIVHPEQLSFAQQMSVFSEAKVIAGVHGAGLTNMLAAPPGAHILEVRALADNHNNCYFALANACRHKYSYLQAQEKSLIFREDLAVDENLLDDALQELET
jgi:capsular polysaccharide biosynthesis protein